MSYFDRFDRLYAMPFNSLEVFNWVLLAGAVCLGYYTLGLMVSTLLGSPGGRHYGFLAEYVARDTDGND